MAISLGVTVMQLCKILQFRLEYFDREDYMCLTFVFLKKTVIPLYRFFCVGRNNNVFNPNGFSTESDCYVFNVSSIFLTWFLSRVI